MTQQELINKYPKIFNLTQTHRVNWGIPEAWVPLVDELCLQIQTYCDEHPEYEQVCCEQMKEKFGGLRFYTNPTSQEVYDLIHKYEKQSYEICQECGCSHNERGLFRTTGWIRILCKDCAITLNKEIHED
jgi:hypothetical protein